MEGQRLGELRTVLFPHQSLAAISFAKDCRHPRVRCPRQLGKDRTSNDFDRFAIVDRIDVFDPRVRFGSAVVAKIFDRDGIPIGVFEYEGVGGVRDPRAPGFDDVYHHGRRHGADDQNASGTEE